MVQNDIVDQNIAEVIEWQRHLHQNPELGFKEHNTAQFVAEKLSEFGLKVHTNISATAVVGVLTSGTGDQKVIFRSELDALPIQENSGVNHSSKISGAMHACGHDAHSSILLGAAKMLAQQPNFDGAIYFLFQPAEEVLGGGKRLLDDGFLEKFPGNAIYSQHNWPGVDEGAVAVSPGPMMAAVDDFTITFNGAGCHAAMPELGDDPVLAAAEFMTSAQRIVSRTIDPKSALVLSFTQIHGGTINNIVPSQMEVQGTARFFEPSHSIHVEQALRNIAAGIAQSHDIKIDLDYRRGYPAVINNAQSAAMVVKAASSFLPDELMLTDLPPSLGCEDFSYLLNAVGNGAYIWLGAGDVGPAEGLHGDRYVFNDKLFSLGMRLWLSIAETALPRGA